MSTATIPALVICPDWCTIPAAKHVADLDDHDGCVVHWSEQGDVNHSRSASPDGTVDPDEPPMVWIDADFGDSLSLGEAEALAHQILAAVKEARR